MLRLASNPLNNPLSRRVIECRRVWAARCKSTAAAVLEDSDDCAHTRSEIHRLTHIRNVGIFAHVDAGKTTVTERMLALAGVVRRAGSVDEGNTVTDYLPAERERGITIQSAAISFEWGWHNNKTGDDYNENDQVTISLIDTPGHVDFSVEVNRSVAVLDGAVLVVDAVAGVQAQTETVWRAMTRPSLNNHELSALACNTRKQDHAHEPLPCLALINKMDKVGCNFGTAVESLRKKLPGANPIPMQMPLFKCTGKGGSSLFKQGVIALPFSEMDSIDGEFVGVVDLIHMRAVLWPDVVGSSSDVADVEKCVPEVIPLLQPGTHQPYDENCQVTQLAIEARQELVEAIADCDEHIEGIYIADKEPSNAELRAALRRATLAHRALPVMASAALRGKGIEPVLDAIADLLPSPLDRMPPALTVLGQVADDVEDVFEEKVGSRTLRFGHSLHPSLLALVFKVVHMKGRGGSGDGRVVFARVYSGELRDRDQVSVVRPKPDGELPDKPRIERIGGILELAGGKFGNHVDGICQSGEVCALVGLKNVVTGDTIMSAPEKSSSKKTRQKSVGVCLAGVSAPKPVLKVRLEAESSEKQSRLSEALALLCVEDPSLVVEETDAATLLSGLGELHIEITLDRLQREFGLRVHVGAPSVAYRETVTETLETDGLIAYDRIIGNVRLQGAVHVRLEPTWRDRNSESSCMLLNDPTVVVSSDVLEYLGIDPNIPIEELSLNSELFKALVHGCEGALKRGPLKSHALTNVKCTVLQVDAEEGPTAFQTMPGSLRAAASNAIGTLLSKRKDGCSVIEPTMSIEVTASNSVVGNVLSDLTARRGSVEDVVLAENELSKALVRGHVPLAEILGYANNLRSITGGEGTFTAEYRGHTLFSNHV